MIFYLFKTRLAERIKNKDNIRCIMNKIQEV